MRKNDNRTKIALLGPLSALVIAVAAYLLISKQDAPLDVPQLKIDAADLTSFAGESQLIVEQALAGRLVGNYFRVHSSLLKRKVEEISRKLEDATPESGLERPYSELKALAKDMAREAGVFTVSWQDDKALAAAKDRFASLRPRLQQLEENLARVEN